MTKKENTVLREVIFESDDMHRDAVSVLERALERLKKGRGEGASVAVMVDGVCYTHWSMSSDRFMQVGALQFLQHRILDESAEEQQEKE